MQDHLSNHALLVQRSQRPTSRQRRLNVLVAHLEYTIISPAAEKMCIKQYSSQDKLARLWEVVWIVSKRDVGKLPFQSSPKHSERSTNVAPGLPGLIQPSVNKV